MGHILLRLNATASHSGGASFTAWGYDEPPSVYVLFAGLPTRLLHHQTQGQAAHVQGLCGVGAGAEAAVELGGLMSLGAHLENITIIAIMSWALFNGGSLWWLLLLMFINYQKRST